MIERGRIVVLTRKEIEELLFTGAIPGRRLSNPDLVGVLVALNEFLDRRQMRQAFERQGCGTSGADALEEKAFYSVVDAAERLFTNRRR